MCSAFHCVVCLSACLSVKGTDNRQKNRANAFGCICPEFIEGLFPFVRI